MVEKRKRFLMVLVIVNVLVFTPLYYRKMKQNPVFFIAQKLKILLKNICRVIPWHRRKTILISSKY